MSLLDTVTDMPLGRLLTTAEAAERAGISPRMMRHYAATGRITAAGNVASTKLFDAADVDDLAGRIERRNRVRTVAA